MAPRIAKVKFTNRLSHYERHQQNTKASSNKPNQFLGLRYVIDKYIFYVINSKHIIDNFLITLLLMAEAFVELLSILHVTDN